MDGFIRQWATFNVRLVLRVAVVFAVIISLFELFSIYGQPTTSIRDEPRPTVGKVMMIYGNNTVYERAVETHKEHCQRHGYPLFLLRGEILDGVWNKLAYLMSLIVQELEKPVVDRLEWLFWIDSDSIIMNPNIQLETFLPPSNLTDVHILIAKDWNGINAGVFPIRVHPWSIELLSAAIGYPFTSPNKYLKFAEQSALVQLFEEHEYFRKSVAYVPLRWFNSYIFPEDQHIKVHPGDLLIHFPGTQRKNFEKTLSPYLDIAEDHHPEWELPIEKTNYTVQTAEFWRDYSAEMGIAKEKVS